MTFALPAVAADDAVKASMKQADSSYDMTKKQAKADEKSAVAQCDTKSGDAKSQCKKDAEADVQEDDGRRRSRARQGEGRLQGEKVGRSGRFAETKTAPEGAVLSFA